MSLVEKDIRPHCVVDYDSDRSSLSALCRKSFLSEIEQESPLSSSDIEHAANAASRRSPKFNAASADSDHTDKDSLQNCNSHAQQELTIIPHLLPQILNVIRIAS